MLPRAVPGVVVGLALAGWCVTAAPALGEAETPSSAQDAAGEIDAGQGAEALNPLGFEPDLALFTALVFLVLLAILWPFWRRVAQGLDKRERGIADEIAQAEHHNDEARKLLEEYQQKLAASGEEVQRMLEAARRDAEQAGQQIVEKAQADADVEHQRILGEIEAATADALKDLARQSATLAVDLAGKIVAAKLDPTAHSRLIEQAVAGFSQRQPDKRGPSG